MKGFSAVASLKNKSLSEPLFNFAQSKMERLSWGEFWAAVNGCAEILRKTTKERDLILIMAATHPAAIAYFFAGMCTRRLVSFFPPPHKIQNADFYLREQAQAIQKINPDLILTFDDNTTGVMRGLGFDHLLRSVGCHLPVGDPVEGVNSFSARLSEVDALPLFIQHSSGTTGAKKSVAITATMLLGQFNSYWRSTIEEAVEAPKIASWLPLYHDMGLLTTLILPTLGGAEVAFVDPFRWVENPQLLFDIIDAERSNLVWMPNFAFRHYVRLKRVIRQRDLSSVISWINCSEPCRSVDVNDFEQAYGTMGVRPRSVVGCYAMAETVFAASQGRAGTRSSLMVDVDQSIAHPVRIGAKAVLSSGTVLPGLEVAILSGSSVLPEQHYGEIGVRGEFLFSGYRRTTKAESNIDEQGFFHTGDLGAMKNGELYVFGRLKEVIIINGKNIFSNDIEASTGLIEGLKPGRAVAFGIDNEATGSEDLVIVAERGNGEREADAIIADVTRLIEASYLIKPKVVCVVDDRWLVKTTSGKISRAENRAKFLRSQKT
jgi:acyl-CoA synthetase (AMP-forming)/AMP-acid ligase II